jgi:hypothetical protein
MSHPLFLKQFQWLSNGPKNFTQHNTQHSETTVLESRADERELIRRAQAIAEAEAEQEWDEVQANRRRRPLYQAGDILVIHHHGSVREIAKEYFGDYENSHAVGVSSHEDRVAAGLEGLWLAARRSDLSRRNGLNASARHWIRKYIREECRLARKRGDSSDTRADRKVYDNRHLTPQQIAALSTRLLCSNKQWAAGVKAAQEAIDRCRVYWHGHDGYHEGFTYDEISKSDGERCSSPSLKYSTRKDFSLHYDFFTYGQPSADSKCLSRTVDALVAERARRDERWLRAMGRRAYALWLWRTEKRRQPIPQPEISMSDYSISINTAATASDSSDWKSDADRLAAAAKVFPTVFDEKDRRWGWYRARSYIPNNETYQPSTAETAGDDHDDIRQEPRHQTGGLRSLNGGCGGDTAGSATRPDEHERHYAPGPVGGAEAARLPQG